MVSFQFFILFLGSLILFDLLCHQKDGISAPKPIEQNEPLNKESQLVKGFHSTNSLTSSKSDYNGDIPTNLTEVLQKLSLEKFMETFESEQVDLDSLVSKKNYQITKHLDKNSFKFTANVF